MVGAKESTGTIANANVELAEKVEEKRFFSTWKIVKCGEVLRHSALWSVLIFGNITPFSSSKVGL